MKTKGIFMSTITCPNCGNKIHTVQKIKTEPKPNPNVKEVWCVSLSFSIPQPNQTCHEAKDFRPYMEIFKEKIYIGIHEFMTVCDMSPEDENEGFMYKIYARDEQEAEEAKRVLVAKYNEKMTGFISYLQHCMVNNVAFHIQKW